MTYNQERLGKRGTKKKSLINKSSVPIRNSVSDSEPPLLLNRALCRCAILSVREILSAYIKCRGKIHSLSLVIVRGCSRVGHYLIHYESIINHQRRSSQENHSNNHSQPIILVLEIQLERQKQTNYYKTR